MPAQNVAVQGNNSVLFEMKKANRWLLWKFVADGPSTKHRKVPYYINGNPRTNLDLPEDMAQLVSYDEAQAALSKGEYEGLGFALGPDGTGNYWQGLDFDNISMNPDEQLYEMRQFLSSQTPFGKSGYVEVSPSGKGIHVIGYGKDFPTSTKPFEAYAKGRFFTFTGRGITSRTGMERPDELIDLSIIFSNNTPRARLDTEVVGGAIFANDQIMRDLWSAMDYLAKNVPGYVDEEGTWHETAFALASACHLWAEDMFVAWSKLSKRWGVEWTEDEGKREARKKFARGVRETRTTYKAIFARAGEHGWQNPASSAAQQQAPAQPEPAPDGVGISRIMAQAQLQAKSKKRLNIVSLDAVPMKAVRWLWKNWLPIGYMTLIAGESKVGKSSVVVDLASRITAGRALPGEVEGLRSPGRIMWLATEDGVGDMLKPRFVSANANLNNLDIIKGTWSDTGNEDSISLVDDLSVIEEELTVARENGRPYDAIIVDPITGYLTSKNKRVDQNSASDLRPILQNFIAFAERNKIAVVAITHFSKGSSKKAAHKVLGSQVFVATSRSLIIIEKMKETEEYVPEVGEGVMRLQDSNLARAPEGSWRFTTKSKIVGWETDGHEITASCIEWGEFDVSLTDEFMSADGNAKPSRKTVFSKWIREYFEKRGQEWLSATEIIQSALPEKKEGIEGMMQTAYMPSKKWWEINSNKFVEKENRNGIWMCRLLK
jgi:hypothetical protein